MSNNGDDLEAGGSVDGDPFAEPSVGDVESDVADVPGGEPGGWVGMLRSTEPPVSPADVGRDMALTEPWYNHFGAMFIKMSGSAGTEAWMHGVMGLGLLLRERAGEDNQQQPDDTTEGLGPAEEFGAQEGDTGPGESFEGPQ